MRRIYRNVTIDLATGALGNSQPFNGVDRGNVVGFSTTVIGTRPQKSVRVVLEVNSNHIGDPIDINFTETKGRASFEDSIIPINYNDPGSIGAKILLDEAVATGEDFSVEVMLVIEQECNV